MTPQDLDALEKLADEVLDAAGDLAFVRATTAPGREKNSTAYKNAAASRNAFILAVGPTTIKALIAELKEAYRVIHRLGSSEAFDMPRAIDGPLATEMRARMDYARAFLARNGKGEGQ